MQVKVAAASTIAEGQVKSFELDGGRKVALARAGGKIFAFEDRCSHDDGELTQGAISQGTEVECPRHGGRFDMASGKATRMPAIAPIQVYEAQTKGDDIWVEFPKEDY